MNLLDIAMIVFFGVTGVSHFVPFKYSGVIIGVAAIIIAVILLIRIV